MEFKDESELEEIFLERYGDLFYNRDEDKYEGYERYLEMFIAGYQEACK